MNTVKINSDVTIAGQPSVEQLRAVSQQGFKSVVNFRTAGEDDQPLEPLAEGKEVETLGMEYLHIPVSMKSLNSAVVDEFRQKYAALPKPVFAHCKGATRAGAMVLMQLALEKGLTSDEMFRQAEQQGFKCEQPQLKEFVKNYIDAQSQNT